MSRIETPDKTMQIVGRDRDETEHYGRAVSAEERVYILHSRECFESGRDLRQCEFSVAMDLSIDLDRWVEDQTVLLAIEDGLLVPDGEGAS